MAKTKTDSNILKEVAALGKQVEKTLRAAAESPELKGIGSEIKNSLGRISDKVVGAVDSAKESAQGRQVGRQFKKVVETGKATGRQAGEELAQNLAEGLKGVGAELQRLADRLKKK